MARNDGQGGSRCGLLSSSGGKVPRVRVRQFVVDLVFMFLRVEFEVVVVVVRWRSSRSNVQRESTLSVVETPPGKRRNIADMDVADEGKEPTKPMSGVDSPSSSSHTYIYCSSIRTTQNDVYSSSGVGAIRMHNSCARP